MKEIQQWFEGRKTYLTCLVGGGLLFGSWQGWWQLPTEVYAGLAALATAFLRAALSRELGEALAAKAAGPENGGGSPSGGGDQVVGVGVGVNRPAVPAPQAAIMVWLVAGGLGTALLAGCGTLDPAGIYKGDKTLYTSDLALGEAYDALHAFVQWEYDNRAALASQPAIRQAANQVRAQSPKWFSAAMALRDAYASAPTAANRDALVGALAVIQQAVSQAAAWQAKPAP